MRWMDGGEKRDTAINCLGEPEYDVSAMYWKKMRRNSTIMVKHTMHLEWLSLFPEQQQKQESNI